jgi:UDP-glucose 4-epimerase
LAGESPKAVGSIFNLGTNVETTINELVETIAGVMGKQLDIRYVGLDDVYGAGYEDIPRRVPNIEHSQRVLDFQAQVPLEAGIRETYKWLLSCSHAPVDK